MKTTALRHCLQLSWLALALAAWPGIGAAAVAGAEIEEFEELPTLTSGELEELVGPIALYPDDLLAIVLPASTFPLQIVEASRFLAALEDDPSLEPDEDWDDAVVALLNYPEVVELLNEDLDWTWRLGEAVVAQQSGVIAAIELFRDRAYAAGNLNSDEHQVVAHEGGAIQITPVEEDVIYVPYYQPERVVVYQPRPVYFYYPRAYPVYYYPYPTYHRFYRDYFWGVTTAFSIGWHTHHLNVFHHSYWGHPYYGRTYWNRWWYRRPDIHVHNHYYARRPSTASYNRYRNGDRWVPNVRRTVRASDQRVTRTRYYSNDDVQTVRRPNRKSLSQPDKVGSAGRRIDSRRDRDRDVRQSSQRSDIRFRDRSGTPAARIDQPDSRPSRFRRATNDRDKYEPGTSRRTSTIRPSSQNRPTQAGSARRNSAQNSVNSYREPRASTRKRPSTSRSDYSAPSRPKVNRQASPRPKASYQRQPQARANQSRPSTSRQKSVRPKSASNRSASSSSANSRRPHKDR